MCNRINSLETERWENERIKAEKEIKKLFEDEGFAIRFENNKYIFKKENTTVEINYIGKDEIITFQMKIIPNDSFFSIQIRPNMFDSKMLNLKKFINLEGSMVNNKNYMELINKCNDANELERIKKLLKDNTDHYLNTIKNYDSIGYIYSLYKESMECESFKKLLEDYILPNA